MAYTLNTGHPLYASLIELIGVQSGALVSHKTARTITPESGSSFGTGLWGEHFHTNGYSYTSRGATISPAIGIDTSTISNYTIVIVVNGSGNSNNGYLLIGTTSPRLWGPRLLNDHIGWRAGLEGSTAAGTGARMLTSCRIGETGGKLYLDKTLEASSVALSADYADPVSTANYLGAADLSGISDVVWAAVFNKELSLAEISSLYDSLGADNAFGLVESGAGVPNLTISDGAHSHAADNLSLAVLGTLTIADAAHSHTTDSITLTATTNGTITIPAVRDWGTKALKTGQTGVQVDIRNITTGALVVRKTGQTTHATTGVCVVTDAAIVAGTTYEVVTRFADGSRGMWDYTAS